ncbi:spore coat U domain-containing protein [Tsuneonella sp. YG55]|uniref:Spore coat U domain-containing protein n=1 Tax=Tsuneonella litorea TaxID=2976475 RepID=A0A9X2W0D0_9SPHN|nr:spore coat U domain-containing protein [Tsuneonella litorea]MCT2557859.1 spore coat U domain-containing protein [Tsuneonella litorea]
MRKFAICAAALAATVATPAMAGPNGTITQTMDVLLNVQTSCTLTTPPAMNFGSVNTVTAGTTTTATTSVQCTPNTPYTLRVDNGQHADLTSGQRRLQATAGTVTVDYDLLQADTTAWPVAGVGGTGSGTAQNYSMVGKLVQTTEVAAGNYADVLTITLDY